MKSATILSVYLSGDRLGQPQTTADAAGPFAQHDRRESGDYYGQHMTAGDIYTIAGGGNSYPGDGGPATRAEISLISVALDQAGNLLIGGSGTISEVIR